MPTVHMPTMQMVHMPSIQILPVSEDKLTRDEEGRKQREDVLRRQKVNSAFYGVQQVFTFLSGVLLSVGMAMLAPEINKEGLSAFTASQSIPALTMLGAAGIAIVTAVGSNQIGARFMHAASFDQSEINAQHTGKEVAKAIRHELEDMQAEQVQPMVVFNNPDAQRADGKAWTEYTQEQKRAAENNYQLGA